MDGRNSNIGPTGGLGRDTYKCSPKRSPVEMPKTGRKLLTRLTNPVESINRQSFKSKNNLNVILENIYLEDRIHAVKMVARSRDVNISYSVDSNKRKNRKRKRTSLVDDAETLKQYYANGPTDQAKDNRTAKRARRRGKGWSRWNIKKKMKIENSVIWDG